MTDILAERAQDAALIISELEHNAISAAEKYGHGETGRPPSFLIKGKGRIASVDTVSRAGTVDLDLAPPDGITDLRVQIGPVIRGTALRDALPFVTFNMFDNQLEHAAVSRELHNLVGDSVLSEVDGRMRKGATISFEGAFTWREDGPVLVTPVSLILQD